MKIKATTNILITADGACANLCGRRSEATEKTFSVASGFNRGGLVVPPQKSEWIEANDVTPPTLLSVRSKKFWLENFINRCIIY